MDFLIHASNCHFGVNYTLTNPPLENTRLNIQDKEKMLIQSRRERKQQVHRETQKTMKNPRLVLIC